MHKRHFLPMFLVVSTIILGAASAAAYSSVPLPPSGGSVLAHEHHSGSAAEDSAFGEPGEPSKVDRVVKISMRDLSFVPNELDVKTGETIRFIVTNDSEADHDFTLGDVATQTAHRKEMAEAMEKAGEIHHHHDANAISVKAHESGELIWKFTRPGAFEFDCNVPGHYEAGMKGVIRVLSKSGRQGRAGVTAPQASTDRKARNFRNG
jgi:uncharacterized cupredoxin-like copper-binding protein